MYYNSYSCVFACVTVEMRDVDGVQLDATKRMLEEDEYSGEPDQSYY